MATQVQIQGAVARRLGLILVHTRKGLPPSLGEPLFDGRAVETMLVGPATPLAEAAHIPACPIHDQPAEVELAHERVN